MKNFINFLDRLFFIIVLVIPIIMQSCQYKTTKAEKYEPEILLTWNEMIMEMAIAEDGLLTLKGVRTEAMMHTAIHDVLNNIRPSYTTYLFEEKNINAEPIAAVAQAAYEISVSQFPDKRTELDTELNRWLETVENNQAKTEGKELGKKVASGILSSRADDGWNDEADYTWHPMAPGVYAEFNKHSGTPEGFIFGSGWAKAIMPQL